MIDIYPLIEGIKRFSELKWAISTRSEKLSDAFNELVALDADFYRIEDDTSVAKYCDFTAKNDSSLEELANIENSATKWGDEGCEDVKSPTSSPSDTRLANRLSDTTQYHVTITLMHNWRRN